MRAPGVLAAGSVSAGLAAWIGTAAWMQGMDMGPGTDLGSLPFFVGLWTTMMAAMMLPSALPMVLVFDRVARERRARAQASTPTALFVATYLVVWAACGLVAYAVYRAVAGAHLGFLAWGAGGPYVAGGAVAAAGLYELTALKRACLRHCRSPLHFVLGGWKHGPRGAVAMGVEHAAYCVGCCWALMVVLFALGVMSLTWMLVVAAIVFAEKVLPGGGARVRVAVAVALVALGLWVALDPASVPGLTVPMS